MEKALRFSLTRKAWSSLRAVSPMGWKLGPVTDKQFGERSLYDIGATLSATPYTTLGELRTAVAEEKNHTP